MLPTVTIRNVNTGQVVTIPRHKAASLGLPWLEDDEALALMAERTSGRIEKAFERGDVSIEVATAPTVALGELMQTEPRKPRKSTK